jgi:hypothetical protein
MSLSSVGNPAWATIRVFGSLCWMAQRSLQSWLHMPRLMISIDARPGVGWYLACFNKHRDAIEQVVSVKHQRGQCEESGAVIVQKGDLNSSGP